MRDDDDDDEDLYVSLQIYMYCCIEGLNVMPLGNFRVL